MNQMIVNRCTIEFIDGESAIVDKPMSVHKEAPPEQAGLVKKFRVTTTDDLDFVFGLVAWPQARPEVRSIEFVDGLSKYERLKGAGRLSFIEVGVDRWLGEINAMKVNTKPYPTLCRPSAEELDYLAGGSFESLMHSHGVLKVGTREALVGDISRERNSPAILVKAGDVQAVSAAFAVTRVMAIMYELGQKP